MKKSAIVFPAFLSMLVLHGCEPVVNMMAFHPDNIDVLSTDRLPPPVQEIFISTQDQIDIQGYFIPNRSSDRILIYFHGNGGNIGHRLPDLIRISSFGINVLGVGYRGYGKSQGKPSERGIYMDGKAALDHVTDKLDFPLHNIIIMGRSIGTTVAIHISQNLDIGGLILVTPLTSGKDSAKAAGLGFVSFLAGDAFNNMGKITNISCPVLVIHGTQDSVIPFEMGERIYNHVRTDKQFVKIEGANHNNLSAEYKQRYWPPIDAFIAVERTPET